MRTMLLMCLIACTTNTTTEPDAAPPDAHAADYSACEGFWHADFVLGNANSDKLDFEVQLQQGSANPRIVSSDTTVFGTIYQRDLGGCQLDIFKPRPSTTGAGCIDMLHGLAFESQPGNFVGIQVQNTTLCAGNFSTFQTGTFILTRR